MINPASTIQARALMEARDRILQHVARRGPLPLAELPAHWPMTRYHARKVVLDLTRDGLLEFSRGPGEIPLVSVTEMGRAKAGAGQGP